MDAALGPHAALFERAVVDVPTGRPTDRALLIFTKEQPGGAMAGSSFALGQPIFFEHAQQVRAHRQHPFLCAFALHADLHAGAIDAAAGAQSRRFHYRKPQPYTVRRNAMSRGRRAALRMASTSSTE